MIYKAKKIEFNFDIMSDKSSSKFPEEAEVVIVGVGGIVGSMLAYWLAEFGQKNVIGLEKSTIIPVDFSNPITFFWPNSANQ